MGEWVWVSEASIAKPITTKTVERIFQTMSQDIGKNVRATDLRYTVMQRAFQQEKHWSIFNKKWAMYENGC